MMAALAQNWWSWFYFDSNGIYRFVPLNFGSGELAQLFRVHGMQPWEQGYESWSWLKHLAVLQSIYPLCVTYVITRETLVRKSIYEKFTMTTTADEIINMNASKAPQMASNGRERSPLMQRKCNAMQTLKRSPTLTWETMQSPIQGIGPWSPVWQVGILTTTGAWEYTDK